MSADTNIYIDHRTRRGHTAHNLAVAPKRHLEVFSEATRVAVDDRLGVSERFDERIDLKNAVLQVSVWCLTKGRFGLA